MSIIALLNESDDLLALLADYRARRPWVFDPDVDEPESEPDPEPGPEPEPEPPGEAPPESEPELPPVQQDRIEAKLDALDDVIAEAENVNDDVRESLAAVDFPARYLGPVPMGTYHSVADWGVHFEVDRGLYIKSATIDSETGEPFDVVLARYDGEDDLVPIQRRSIEPEAGRQRIDLDFTIPAGGGEFLLYREGTAALRRGEWTGWGAASRDGLTIHGGSKAGDFEKPNPYYYYFFQLSVAVNRKAALPEPEVV